MGSGGYKLGTLGAIVGALFAILAFFVGFSSERVINATPAAAPHGSQH